MDTQPPRSERFRPRARPPRVRVDIDLGAGPAAPSPLVDAVWGDLAQVLSYLPTQAMQLADESQAPAAAPQDVIAVPDAAAAQPEPVQPATDNEVLEALFEQNEALRRRAAAAEARARALETQLAAEHEGTARLGRRFGQLPHESFLAFVARLGMMAKAVPLSRASNSRPGSL
jgi:hypothetical protein